MATTPTEQSESGDHRELRTAVSVIEVPDRGGATTECGIYFDVIEELLFAAGWRGQGCCAALGGHVDPETGKTKTNEDETGGRSTRHFVVTRFAGLGYARNRKGLTACGRGALERMVTGDGDVQPVGLFVGRPGSRGEVDEALVEMHMNLLNGPGRVLLVADPQERRIGAYTRGNGEALTPASLTVLYEPGALTESSDQDHTRPEGDDDGATDDGESDAQLDDHRDRGPRDSGQSGEPDDRM